MTDTTIERYLSRELLDQPLEFQVTDPGDFHPVVATAEVNREPGLLLACSFSTPATSTHPPRGESAPAGTTLNAKPVRGTAGFATVELQGAFQWNESVAGDGSSRITAECNRALVTVSDETPSYIVEWICNAKCPAGIYPRATSSNVERTLVRERDGREERIRLDLLPRGNGGFSRDHMRLDLSFGGRTVRVRVGSVGGRDDALHRAFIEYENGAVTPDERVLVRAALAFSYGRQIVLLGVTTFDAKWRPIRLESERGNLLGSTSDFRRASLAPTDLGTTFVDEEIVSRVVNGFLAVSEKGIDLDYPTWLLWLARDAPLDTAPAVLGSALEALRRSYLDQAGSGATKILAPPIAKPIVAALKAALANAAATADAGNPADAAAVRLLTNKISQLNDMSSSMQYPEFFDRLGLPIGTVEAAALKERNRPAHGHRYGDADYAELSKKVYALHSLANRVILMLCDADVTYTDYYTLGHPELRLDQPLGSVSGAG